MKNIGALITAILGLFILFRVAGQSSAPAQSLSPIENLQSAFGSEGLNSFMLRKQMLRKKIAQTINDPEQNAGAFQAARNLAVYLFPDLLDEQDFEKQLAENSWLPLEKLIEQSPRTTESRTWFEELKADILNYERPRGDQSGLSTDASEVIRLYDVLSK